ncbi:MAG: NADPH-dependent FMN reductase [Bdellovibrionales bacterium]
MIEVISGTDRPGSVSVQISRYVVSKYEKYGQAAQLLDLAQLNLGDANGGGYYQGAKGTFREGVDRVTTAEGLVVVVPEYNGSFPGILKLFIDYWQYPRSFESRPIAFIGLGGRWGGLRPVEHLQQVFSYRNGYLFPNRVFMSNVKESVKEGRVVDPMLDELLDIQTKEFCSFLRALKSEKLDANSRLNT